MPTISLRSSASFDVVCLNAVFHWLPDKAGPLREIARVLKPRGRIGIGGGAKEPRLRMGQVMVEVLARPPFAAYPRPRDLVWRVDEKEMRALLEAAGFEATGSRCTTCRMCMHRPMPPSLFRSELVRQLVGASALGAAASGTRGHGECLGRDCGTRWVDCAGRAADDCDCRQASLTAA